MIIVASDSAVPMLHPSKLEDEQRADYLKIWVSGLSAWCPDFCVLYGFNRSYHNKRRETVTHAKGWRLNLRHLKAEDLHGSLAMQVAQTKTGLRPTLKCVFDFAKVISLQINKGKQLATVALNRLTAEDPIAFKGKSRSMSKV